MMKMLSLLGRTGAALALLGATAACSDDAPAQAARERAATPPAQITQADPDARLIVAFGDSLYAGYGLSPQEGFAPQLQNALASRNVAARVHPAGVSGDTTAAGLARLAFTLDGLPGKPDLVIIGLGGNDMLRGIAPDQTRANLKAMLEELDRRDIPAMLTGMLAPPNLGEEYAAAFNRIYPDLARDHGAALYPFMLDGLVGQRRLFLPDGIHPTAEGVEMIAQKVAPAVERALPPE